MGNPFYEALNTTFFKKQKERGCELEF
jgi:hypothetical protein